MKVWSKHKTKVKRSLHKQRGLLPDEEMGIPLTNPFWMGASLDGVFGALSGPGLPDCKSKSDGFLLKDFRRIVDSSVCKSRGNSK